jgi:very-short-patch-repair endonuclease
MDFLMLLRNASRIVIEIDGVQHYSDENGRAAPKRYAEMVAEDRRIRGLGYEVYRFGGAEFVVPERASETLVTFFEELFIRHGISPGLK